MKTIQINDFLTERAKKKRWNLLKQIYKKFLQNDGEFHYLFEPAIVLRIENEETIKKVKDYLEKKHFLFEIYDYPRPKNNRHFGESEKTMLKYNEIFLKIFHQIAIYYMKASDKEREEGDFRERITHILYNMAQFSHFEEAIRLGNMAIGRGFIAGSYSH